jgi:transcriptional regulator with XRE-family HTH domain
MTSEVIIRREISRSITSPVIATRVRRANLAPMSIALAPIGELVRTWRERRRLSQLDLASEAEVSQRHLSFIESGRSAPSRDMVLHLADRLDVPLRERNAMLLAAGFAPIFRDRPLDDPSLAPALATLKRLLKAHEPYPALTLDRHWNRVAANSGIGPMLAAVDPELLKPPVNVIRISLHPRGLAPLILNLRQWREHLLDRLKRQCRIAADPALEKLLAEVSSYPQDFGGPKERTPPSDDIAAPFRLRTQRGILNLFSTVTVFGTALDIGLSEITLEAFYPLDEATAAALREVARPG